jgi:lysophospholipase L1-like esterase
MPSPLLSKHRDLIKRWAIKQLKVLGVLVVLLLVAELGLRLVGYSMPSLYTTDRDLGFSLRAGAEGWWRREGEAYIKINSDGLRDREHNREKPPGTLRIAVLGDSWAEALQVPVEKTFWDVMGRKLSECESLPQGKQIEVINFGVSGYGTAQELITLRRKVWAYSPDIVLLAFNGGNDVKDNSRALKKEEMTPYFIYRDGALSLDSSFLNARGFYSPDSFLYQLSKRARDYSRLAQFVLDLPNVIRANEAARARQGVATAKGGAAEQSEAGLDMAAYSPPADPVWQEAWAVTEELISLMHDEVLKSGAKFLVVTLNHTMEVYPDARVREETVKRLGISDFSYPDRRIRALGERKGFEVLSLGPPLQTFAEQRKVFLHGFGRTPGVGHWNETGHAVGGEMMAHKICEMIR